jgi:hypothetical protein
VRPYGSFVSGLFSPEGDLDMALDGFLDYKCACVPELRSRMHSVLVECCGTSGSTSSPAARCMRQHHGDHICILRCRDGKPPVPICQSSTPQRADMLRVRTLVGLLPTYSVPIRRPKLQRLASKLIP